MTTLTPPTEVHTTPPTLETLCAQHQDRADLDDRSALNELLKGMQALIVKIAMGFLHHNPTIEKEDLIQEGLFACMDAAKYWKRDKGFQYNTYAADCARRRISKYLNTRKLLLQPLEEISAFDGHKESVLDQIEGRPDAEVRMPACTLTPIERRIISRKGAKCRLGFSPRQRAIVYRQLATLR